jgi:hypothetical protein
MGDFWRLRQCILLMEHPKCRQRNLSYFLFTKKDCSGVTITWYLWRYSILFGSTLNLLVVIKRNRSIQMARFLKSPDPGNNCPAWDCSSLQSFTLNFWGWLGWPWVIIWLFINTPGIFVLVSFSTGSTIPWQEFHSCSRAEEVAEFPASNHL